MVGHGDDWCISAKTLKTRALAMLSWHEWDPKYEYGSPLYELSPNGLKFFHLRYRRNWRYATPYKTFTVSASNLVYPVRHLSIWEAVQLRDPHISKYNL
ncbi:MAG: hypothetical protein J6Y94_00865 [Bacteriovoracaceae bacterium]|nr:hypothetical protein [Bacteriovoracaceae bacterium]